MKRPDVSRQVQRNWSNRNHNL